MASFWLTKRALLEALKMSEGLPQSAMIGFKGDSERKNGKDYTVFTISINGKTKTIKDEFHKLLLKNDKYLDFAFEEANKG